MPSIIIHILAGFVLLYFGAELLVRGGSRLAVRLGLTPLVIGLTVVAYGTGLPEILVGSQAAIGEHGGIAVGNVVGSNIFNIAVIMGLCAVIRPLRIHFQVFRLDMRIMVLVSLLFLLLFQDHRIGRIEGSLLFLGTISYTVATIYLARREAGREIGEEFREVIPAHDGSVLRDSIWVVTGMGLLLAGTRFLIDGSVDLARMWSVREGVIGITIVAAGTSLPELAISLIAVRRREPDIAIGNIVGSNIVNILCVLGIAGLLSPVEAPGVRPADSLVMVGTAILLPLMVRSGLVLSRREGALLLCIYASYMIYIWPK